MTVTLLQAIREVQIPLLAAMLLGACGAKVTQVLRAGGPSPEFGPTALFPVNFRRPVALAVCAVEFSLGLGLIVTAGIGGRSAAMAFRAGACLFFIIATCALVELRVSRPDAGCGCFGDLSTTPVNLRTIARSALLAIAAFASIPLVSLKPPSNTAADYAELLGILAAELLVIGALSPEIGEGLIRLGYSEPCELQIVPSGRTLAALHRSRQWRRHSRLITSAGPADIWRELCWRYVVYPASYDDRAADLVFAVFLKYHRPAIRAALVDATSGQPLPWPETTTRSRLLRRSAPAPLTRLAGELVASPAVPVRADLPVSTDV
jgi:hypothetical protein